MRNRKTAVNSPEMAQRQVLLLFFRVLKLNSKYLPFCTGSRQVWCEIQSNNKFGDQRSKDQNKIFHSNQHLSHLLHCITAALFITWSALLLPQAVTMERTTKHIKVRCWQQPRLGSLGVSVSVGTFSSVLLLVREYQWSRRSLPVISIGLLKQPDSWGTDGSLATQWTLQLFIHGYRHPNLFQIPAYSSIVDQSELLLCPSTGPGQSTRPTASTADKLPNLCWSCPGKLGPRWNKSTTEPAAQKASDADVLASVSALGSDLLLRPEAAAVQAAGSGQIFGWRQIRDITGGCDRRSKPVWHRVDPWFWVQLLSFLLFHFFPPL